MSPQPLNLQLFNRNTAICIGLRSDGEGPACLRRLASDADAEQLMMPEARVAPDFPATIANTSYSIHIRQTLTFLLQFRLINNMHAPKQHFICGPAPSSDHRPKSKNDVHGHHAVELANWAPLGLLN